jgi:hypothetical protein
MQGMISIRDVVHTMLKEHRWGPLFSLVSTILGGEGARAGPSLLLLGVSTKQCAAVATGCCCSVVGCCCRCQRCKKQGPAGVQPQRTHHKCAGLHKQPVIRCSTGLLSRRAGVGWAISFHQGHRSPFLLER